MPRKPSLARLLKKWAPRLDLEKWELNVSYVKKLDRKPDIGDCFALPSERQAEVRLIDPDVWPHDVERTFVHELIHIVTWWTRLNGDNTHRNIVGEHSVETLARALVDLDRSR